ncbi:cytochrome c oxidase assembly protein [Geobacillus sp. 46C-IIa]|uniref:cytochrome c oxidase assembly protein n=1 Tax=Geobacillus sp. 46C-IIa TaxID=1963025 RepID=UPI001301D52A|nr:cytochrome c oxidase assembly protein [Geobacillus sp. 46C-IIa]QNU27126.1 cytochrome c oxidase assembly protein [Geobacillus sp. 46C-IIa]
MNHHHDNVLLPLAEYEILFVLAFVLSLVAYSSAALVSSRRRKPWPLFRIVCWGIGTFCAMVAIIGPLAHRAHGDFVTHMWSHWLLAMLAPLLMAMAKPVALLLQMVPTHWAQHLFLLLKSWPLRFLRHPATAVLLHTGGLWIVYTTPFYAAMYENTALYLFVHLHMFLAGYLFTAVILAIEPMPNRPSFTLRVAALITASAAHAVLAKYIYAHPPKTIPVEQAKAGAMVMYYSGDVIDISLMIILFAQWYRANRPRALPFAADAAKREFF